MKEDEKIRTICSHIEELNKKLKEDEELENRRISSIKNNIEKTENEIRELNSKINSSIYLKKEEYLISLIFKVVEKDISFSVLCKNTDLFRVAFDKFKEKYSDIDEDVYNIIFDNSVVKLEYSLDKYGLKNGDIINLIRK